MRAHAILYKLEKEQTLVYNKVISHSYPIKSAFYTLQYDIWGHCRSHQYAIVIIYIPIVPQTLRKYLHEQCSHRLNVGNARTTMN